MTRLAGPAPSRPTLPAAGRRRFSRAGAAPAVVLMLLAGCFGGGGGQPPQPPEPPWVCPIPAPWCDEVGQQCSTPESPCVHNPTDDPEACELAAACLEPEPPPEPEPEPEPEPGDDVCTTRLDGEPLMGGPTSHQKRVFDATPLLKNMERCRDLGFLINGQPRMRCPAAQEGSPQRYPCEVELMGGPVPLWDLVVESGDLKRGNSSEDWAYRVKGSGKGKLRSCYPNMRACSRWEDIEF